MLEKLHKMLSILGLRVEEWELDKKLFAAIINHDKFSNIIELCNEYDALYEASIQMKLSINSKYSWFYRMQPENKKQKKKQLYGRNN